MKALRTYNDVAAILAGHVKAIVRDGSGRRMLSDHERELIRDHQKIILMVLELEAKLLKHRAAGSGGDGADIDLASARSEIARRLDRLAAVEPASQVD